MSQANALLFLHAQSALHPGTGSGLGAIDMPVQRERHTEWPVIPGSTLKGVLRDTADPGTADGTERERWLAVFGPETANAADHAGAAAFSDARILAFPVRSLKGVFAWVTCPAVLGRLARDLALGGIEPPTLPALPSAVGNKPEPALCAMNSPLLLDGGALVLEEFDFERAGGLGEIGRWLAENAAADDVTQQRLADHLVVVPDDAFTHFVRHATEVLARIALDPITKTVRDKALFYQEFLPPETLFYAVVLAGESRRKGNGNGAAAVQLSAAEVRDWLGAALAARPYLQIGGDASVGKGICTVKWLADGAPTPAGAA